MEQKKKVDITVGSVVRVIKTNERRFLGRCGVVVSVIKEVGFVFFSESIGLNHIKVQIDGDYLWCYENQLQLITSEKQKVPESPKPSPKRTIVIEITDNGANAKYVCGKEVKKTAAIKRHPDDKPDDEVAASLVIAKLFGKNLRDLENAADKIIRNRQEAIGWINGAMEALDEAGKRILKLI